MATTKAKHPPGQVYALADDFSVALAAQQEGAATVMLGAWTDTYAQVRLEYDQVLAKIKAAEAAGEAMSPAWAFQKARLKGALDATKVQVNAYAQHAAAEVTKAQQAAIAAAAKHAAKMGQQALADAGMAAGFLALEPDTLQFMAGFLNDGTPVSDLFTGYGEHAAAEARRVFSQGLALGKGPDWIARHLDQALDVPRQRAMTIARTESLRVYREATRATYLANADVVGSWVWRAALDSRTCPACVVMDGTEHPVGATLDGHPNCRCAMVPRTPSWEDLLGPTAAKGIRDTRPPIRKGTEWFKDQPSTVQRAILGPRKFSAWTRGEFDLEDMVARPQSLKWGTMRRERTMAEMKAGVNANWEDKVERPRPPVPAPNPATVKRLAHSLSYEEVKDALDGPLTRQQALDYKAAEAWHLSRMDLEYGVRWDLPKPAPAVVDKAAAKMQQAALTKGYPSKGYSQTVAIYKAQANGVVGQKVGVVKSLTWEQKVNAQAALAKHDEWLKDWAAAEAKTAGVADDLLASLKANNMIQSDMDLDKAYKNAKAALDAMPTGPAKTKGLTALDAWKDGLLEVAGLNKDLAKTHSTKWFNEHGHMLTVYDDGWGAIKTPQGQYVHLSPAQVHKDLTSGTFNPGAPVVQPNIAAKYLEKFKAMAEEGDDWEDEAAYLLESARSMGGMQGHQSWVNVADAKAQMDALYPKPNPVKVKELMDLADNMADTGHLDGLLELVAKNMADAKVSPQDKVDFQAFMAQYQAKVAAQAKPVTKAKAAKTAPDPAPPVQGNGPTIPGFGAGPDPADLKSTGKTLGTHGATVYRDPQGATWLVKGPKDPKDQFLVTLDEAASRLQAASGLTTPDTFVATVGGRRQSIQRMFDAKDAFPGGTIHAKNLSAADLETIQRHQVLDWLMSNHDGHAGQFMRLKDGTLVGIDKGQAFRWMGQDRLDWDFHPNAYYGTQEPVYNTLWREFAQGRDGDLLDPSTGSLAKYIADLKAIPDDELRALFRPYAEQAAQRGRLAAAQQQFPGVTKPTVPANDVDAFLDALVARKNNLDKDLQALYAKAAAERAKNLPDWKPTKPAPTKGQRAKGKKSLEGAPKPTPPTPPAVPSLADTDEMKAFLADAKARYKGFSGGKNLENSNNWKRFQAVVNEGSLKDLDDLLARQYITEDMHARAKAVLERHAKAARAADAAHAKAMKAYQQELKDWRDANGITDLAGTLGHDGAKRFKTTTTGRNWGAKHWPLRNDPIWSDNPKWLKAVREYTGSGYSNINYWLRAAGTAPHAKPASITFLDEVMEQVARVPEDVVVTRRMGSDAFRDKDGNRLTFTDDVRTALMEADVQQDLGYMSTSVNMSGAMSGNVTLRLRVPAGHKALYVSGKGDDASTVLSSVGKGEAELILDRGTKYVVHRVRKVGSTWYVDAEVVPEDWVKPADWTPANITDDD